MNSTKKMITLLIVVACCIPVVVFGALNPPHHPDNSTPVNCDNCHMTYSAELSSPIWQDPPVDMDDVPENRICWQCHDGSITVFKDTHSSLALGSNKYGDWTHTCVRCHDPHVQRQVYHNEYLTGLTGTIAGVDAVTRTFALGIALPDRTGDADPTDDYVGWTIVPETFYKTINYKIASNTATTVTVTTPISTGRVAVGDTFGILVGRFVEDVLFTPSGWKNVKFYSSDGEHSFADSDGLLPAGQDSTPDGICQVCHMQTSHWRNDGSLAAIGVHAGQNGGNCMNCHDHTRGFAALCDGCHGSPPVEDTINSASTGGNSGLVDDPGTTGSTTAGAHDAHVNTEGIGCESCHYNSAGSGSTHNDGAPQVITLGFYLFSGAYQGGSYDGQASAQYDASTTSPPTTVSSGDSKTCSALYCHGDYPGSGLSAAPVWDDPATGDCGTCHGASNASDSFPGSGRHERHADSDNTINAAVKSTFNRNYECTLCHTGIVGGNGPGSYTIDDPARHANSLVDWSFDTGDPRLSSGSTYSIASGTQPPSDGTTPRSYGTCSTIYCHSNVQPNGGVGPPSSYDTVSWSTGSLNCQLTCHAPDDLTYMHGTTINTGSHATHMVYEFTVETIQRCTLCHKWNASASTNDCNQCHTQSEQTYHVNGSVDLMFDSAFVGSTAQYSGTPSPGDGYGTCTNVYCHSTVQSSPPGSGPTYRTTGTWGTSEKSCDRCHYHSSTTPSLATGSHQKHFEYPDGGIQECYSCHNYGNTDDACFSCHSVSITPPEHVNRSIDVIISPALGGSYDGSPVPDVGYGSCSNTYCHGNYDGSGLNASPTWGTPLSAACGTCHGASNTTVPASGSHTAHALSSNQNYACTLCHNVTIGGTGPSSYTIANKSRHISSTVHWAFDASDVRLNVSSAYSITSGSAVPSDGTTPRAYGTCSDTACHGITTSPTWGTNFAGIDTCTKCHGTSTPTATVTDADKAPPTDLAGHSVNTDPQVGAHQIHLTNSTIRDAINCIECHMVPATFTSTGHIYDSTNDTTFGVAEVPLNGTLASTGGLTPQYNSPAAGQCSGTWCHGAGLVEGDKVQTWYAPVLTGVASNDCNQCHGYPSNSASITDHAGLDPGIPGECAGCHDHVNNTNDGFVNIAKHIDGTVDGGSCVGCHSTARGSPTPYRRIITGTSGDIEPGLTSHHIQYTTLDPASCEACHDQSNHKSNADPGVLLAEPDTGATITYTGINTELTTFCQNCHDADGAARLTNPTQPFIDSGDTTSITGTLNVESGHSTADCMGNCHGNNGGTAGNTINPKLNAHGSTLANILNYAGTWGAGANVSPASSANCYDCHTVGDTVFNEHGIHLNNYGLTCFTCHLATPHGGDWSSGRWGITRTISGSTSSTRGRLLVDGAAVSTPYRGSVVNNIGGIGDAPECSQQNDCYIVIKSFATSGNWTTANCAQNSTTNQSVTGNHAW